MKQCPNCEELVGDDVKECFNCHYNFIYKRVMNPNEVMDMRNANERLQQEREEKQILIVGLQTDFCIDATIKSGFEHGFDMIVPEYTNSTFDNKYFSKEAAYKYYNNFMWPDRYARCITMKDALEMLGNK